MSAPTDGQVRKLSLQERRVWGTCPTCQVEHGDPCRQMWGEMPFIIVHEARMAAAPDLVWRDGSLIEPATVDDIRAFLALSPAPGPWARMFNILLYQVDRLKARPALDPLLIAALRAVRGLSVEQREGAQRVIKAFFAAIPEGSAPAAVALRAELERAEVQEAASVAPGSDP